jgi:serine/threonine-protein kinase
MSGASRNENQGIETGARSLLFGEFRVDLERHVLLHGNTRIRIQKKPLAVLIYLMRQAPRLVPRDELLERFWSRAVNEEVLTRCISTIRKHLGDNEDPPQFIETYRGQGYRFIANVAATAPAETSPPVSARLDDRAKLAAAGVVAILIIAVSFWPEREPDVTSVDRIERIAVLPLSVDGSRSEWLRPALSDHLMRAVSRIEGVTVVSSNADPDELDLQSHVDDLNVQALLLTRLERTSSGSALGAQLIAVEDSSLLWSAVVESEYEFSSGNQVQELAQRLAVQLRPALQLGERRSRVDQRAYSYYLQGRYYWAQRSAIGLEAAIAAYDAALAIDKNYSDALLGSAETWLLMPLYGAMAPGEAIPKARALAERALELDSVSGRARGVLGVIAMQYDWDWSAAETLLREAVALNPNDATAQQWLGELFCYTGRFEECARQLRIASQLDPLSPVLQMQRGSPALYAGDYARAEPIYSAASRNAPEFALGRYVLGLACTGLGDWPKAISAYRSALPELGLAIVGGPLVYALNKSGSVQEALQVLRDLEQLAATRYVPPSKMAVAYLGIGDRDRALAELWRAVEKRDDRLVYYLNEVHFRDLIAEEGFRDIARHIGL